MENTKTTRALGFLIDYVIWYLLMYIMILFYFFVIEKHTAFSGNLQGYADIFAQIMKQPSFILIYGISLILYEICIPLLFGGQTISKRILKTEIVPFTVKNIVIRGFIKLCIINPCGVVSYLLALVIAGNSSLISDGLWILLFIDIVFILLGKSALHDIATKTTVNKKVGEVRNEIYNSKRV
ncbi:putative RDD family membrane protein YckC [Breznakia sp. PF5-3]|uniref:RDD family protein n=1 Tax=unclassified Breznakia TaxID=2623764 RepID=UPI002406214D|nr:MULTISPECIES: RDD family protein [unclassified Breznakia]MDL2276574.1 RDD family protein [Breznakia sp. OttesenSCG-928-G09]MDF9823856.1 putative RDD family membrane protein YckC [Breznakia sp. PM6-1]MDF9834578.1 putative RDD family membrane protein YckC [Breznakia sp. PF5-3]MDF9836805.1 putative RDD family membrane protein YckC [Breznakia sp. PFB2-8]MDF9858746.1 putative RDD family membrane protein YckC [Breznakia sp. PH5-24]